MFTSQEGTCLVSAFANSQHRKPIAPGLAGDTMCAGGEAMVADAIGLTHLDILTVLAAVLPEVPSATSSE
jgi:hypothetical protein